MRKAMSILAFVAAAALCASAADAAATFGVRAASYNIRCELTESDSANNWSNRKGDSINLVKSIAPDVIGFQEVRSGQYTYLRNQLSDYTFVGEYRDTVSNAEATPVAFRKDRFTLLDSDTFWLSATPEVVGSKVWGGGIEDSGYPRICTWTLLKDEASGGVFCFASTHLDLKEGPRLAGVRLILSRLSKFEAAGVPVVLVGDMNALETEDSMVEATEVMQDALLVSETSPTGPWRTLSGFNLKDEEISCADALANYTAGERSANTSTLGKRIDYIFTSPGTGVESFSIRNDARPGMQYYPSDHYPVAADLVLPCQRDGWIVESFMTAGRTGAWSEPVSYGADGRAYLGSRNGQVLFTPYNVSTGNVVTVETTARFYAYVGHDTPDATAQAAVRLGTNGCFQVWTHLRQGYGGQAGWVDVVAEGMTPESGEEYTLRTTFDYTANIYSVEVRTGLTGWTRFEEKDNPVNPVNPVKTSFPLAASTNCVSSIAFVGDTLFASLYGECRYEVIGFQPGEISVGDATVILDAAKAAWLNARGDYAAVNSRLANITSNEFATAWLCNLDLMNEDASAELKIADIKINADNVEIAVALTRTGAISQEINGVLKFYGAATLAAFKDDAAQPIASMTLVDDDFSEGDTATGTFSKGDNTFFNAAVEER